jgi:hypothetical protein
MLGSIEPECLRTSAEMESGTVASPRLLTFDCVLVAAGREPSGFAAFAGHSPDGLRRSANKVSAIGRERRERSGNNPQFGD